MKKKIIGFGLFTSAILLMVVIIYGFTHTIVAAKDKIDINMSSTCLNGYSNTENLQNFIKNSQAYPEELNLIFEGLTAIGSVSNEHIKKLGIEEVRHYNANSFSIKEHCSVIRVDQPAHFRYQWTNSVENGTIRFVIMKEDGQIIYENNRPNTSEQSRIQLPAGNYFVFAEINCEATGIVKYDLKIMRD